MMIHLPLFIPGSLFHHTCHPSIHHTSFCFTTSLRFTFSSIVQSLCFFQFLSRCPSLSLPPSVAPVSPDSLTSSLFSGLAPPPPPLAPFWESSTLAAPSGGVRQVSPQVLHTLTQTAAEENLPTPHDHSGQLCSISNGNRSIHHIRGSWCFSNVPGTFCFSLTFKNAK